MASRLSSTAYGCHILCTNRTTPSWERSTFCGARNKTQKLRGHTNELNHAPTTGGPEDTAAVRNELVALSCINTPIIAIVRLQREHPAAATIDTELHFTLSDSLFVCFFHCSIDVESIIPSGNKQVLCTGVSPDVGPLPFRSTLRTIHEQILPFVRTNPNALHPRRISSRDQCSFSSIYVGSVARAPVLPLSWEIRESTQKFSSAVGPSQIPGRGIFGQERHCTFLSSRVGFVHNHGRCGHSLLVCGVGLESLRA